MRDAVATKKQTIPVAPVHIADQGRSKPHIVLIIPRGEAVRNFLYSQTLRVLSEQARVTVLSVVYDEQFVERFSPYCEEIIELQGYREHPVVEYLRALVQTTHFRWLWSKVAQNNWETWEFEADTPSRRIKWEAWKLITDLLAHRPMLEALTRAEQQATWRLRPTDDFDRLFERLKPDLVFNGSHIHGPAASLPVRVANGMGIPTAGFVFSWDNLTSRSRIFEPYDFYLVWHNHMRDQLRSIYPFIPADRVLVTGTPQLDFHFDPHYCLSREELARRIGFDPQRPYILYTTGIARHFPEEHHTVELVIRLLQEMDLPQKPQLVVRTYVKGTSPEMWELARRNTPDVFFPEVLWDAKWFTPKYEDLEMYTSMVKHAALGINAASTVTLELLMHDRPVINLGLNPPGTSLPHHLRYSRHILFDHFQPIARSGAVMVAWSENDMERMLYRGLTQPQADSAKRKRLLEQMFGNTLDGYAGQRVAEQLLALARQKVAAAR
jgi:hypothetical protein